MRDAAPSVLGTGAELKNAICLTRGREAFLSQHIGDLENLETLGSFEHAIAHLERLLEIKPEIIVHDLHPDYLSTQWALRREGLPRIAVQHHHAHIAAVMAERRLEGPVIGLALDGTGFGTDGTIWGGEVLRVDKTGFERLGHLRQVLLPGGDKAVKQPWRMALSYLWSLDPETVGLRFADILAKWPAKELKIILQMLARRINSPVTSSCGRLFDAVSALCGIRNSVNYEGQAAIELEQAIVPDEGLYEGKITLPAEGGGMFVIDPFPMIEAVVEDVRRNCPAGKIAARFHNGIISLLAEAGRFAAERAGLKRIAFSGGVFQNAYLSERLERELSGLGFEVYGHIEVPANDACIALGQAYIGAQKLLEEQWKKTSRQD
jgi:hydrogenase maturation protein HypF